jgi:hypothetical protein
MVRYWMKCDGAARLSSSAKTLAPSGPLPKPPTVRFLSKVGDKMTFEVTSDPSEPTVFWLDDRRVANTQLGVNDDLVATFAQKKYSIVASAASLPNLRLCARNSGGTGYPPFVP